MIRYINGVPNAPKAIGPYSQAVVCNGLIYLSGQIPIHPETGTLVEGGIESQTNQVMKNLLAVLGFMNIDFHNVLKTTIFLTDLSDFQVVNSIYAKWVGDVKPARATVQVAALPMGAKVEIELVAVLELHDEAMIPHGETEVIEGMGTSGFGVEQKSGRAN